jgi:exosortase
MSESRPSLFRSSLCSIAAILLAAYIALNWHRMILSQDGFIRFTLSLILSAWIMFRPKKSAGGTHEEAEHSKAALLGALLGLLITSCAMIFQIRSAEWLGILILSASALSAGLPASHRRDILLSFTLLFWAHPIPGNLFMPMQLQMQEWSVAGSEWLLHACNFRVWADGLILHTGANMFEIPQWCSGMRTATTVFLLAWGLCLILRLRFTASLALIVIALAQALLLNIIRISTVVFLAPGRGDPDGIKTLHDTAGIVLLATVFIVSMEILFWARRTQRSNQGMPENSSLFGIPPFWHFILQNWKAITAVFLLLSLSGLAAYRRRPAHRAEMIKPVAETFRDRGELESAERAATAAMQLVPHDQDWHLVLVRIQLLRGKYTETIASLSIYPETDSARTLSSSNKADMQDMEICILRAYANIGIGNIREASRLAALLPESERKTNPMVAMVLAEIAYFSTRPDDAAEAIVTAARWAPNTNRIRSLYPFLRKYRKWQAISQSNIWGTQFDSMPELLSAAEAHMNLDEVPAVASLATEAIKISPNDTRILEVLFFMAGRYGATEWEDIFAAHFQRCLAALDDPEKIFAMFGKTFELCRPDLAWAAYRRIEQIAPDHPALSLAPAYYGDLWFLFRKRYLAVSDRSPSSHINVKAMVLLSMTTGPWIDFHRNIPLGRELAINTSSSRRAFLSKAIETMTAMRKEQRLSQAMTMELARAMEMSGDISGSITLMEQIRAGDNGVDANRLITSLSGLYERTQAWQDVYETLREDPDKADPLRPLILLIRLCRAQLNLKLHLNAAATARHACSLYPQSSLAISMLAESLIALGEPEEALFALRIPGPWRDPSINALEAQALLLTERYVEMQDFCEAHLIPDPPLPEHGQSMYLPPAETVFAWLRTSLPAHASFEETVRLHKSNIRFTTSPFLAGIMKLWIDCWETKGAPESSQPEQWLACGRDNREKAVALNQLTLLLCRFGRIDDARKAAEQAAGLAPDMPILWRILLSLSNGSPDVAVKAASNCPDDSELWLANVVLKVSSQLSATNTSPAADIDSVIAPDIKEAVKRGRTPAALARAAEFLKRNGLPASAGIAAQAGFETARGLLPAYLVKQDLAIQMRDQAAALAATRMAIANSITPSSDLYSKLVALKSSDDILDEDPEMINALRQLSDAEPGNPRWAHLLGYIRYRRGGWEILDAFQQMNTAIESGLTNRSAYVYAAEASRQLGNPARGADLLKTALKKYPDDPGILNNLIYTLACVRDTISGQTNMISAAGWPADGRSLASAQAYKEALDLIPRLLRILPDDANALDTAAFACLQAGRTAEAKHHASRMRDIAGSDELLLLKADILEADIALREGRFHDTIALIEKFIKKPMNISQEDLVRVNVMWSEATKRQHENIKLP